MVTPPSSVPNTGLNAVLLRQTGYADVSCTKVGRAPPGRGAGTESANRQLSRPR
jgi:hypothetical protein